MPRWLVSSRLTMERSRFHAIFDFERQRRTQNGEVALTDLLDLSLNPVFKVTARENIDRSESGFSEIIRDALALASTDYRDVCFLLRLPQQQFAGARSTGSKL